MKRFILPSRRSLIVGVPTIMTASLLGVRSAFAVTIFSQIINSIDSDEANNSHRQDVPVTGASLGQVRVTFASAAGKTLAPANCSIGVAAATGTNANITGAFGSATFRELTFTGQGSSGGHGFNVTDPVTAVSDWVNLTFASTDHLIVVIDYGTFSPNQEGYTNPGIAGGTWWHASGTSSYNQATVPSFTGSTAITVAITTIETQAGVSGGGGSSMMIMNVGQ